MSKKIDSIYQNMTVDLEGVINYILENVDSSILSKLADYVKFTDYATSSKGGVIKVNDNIGTKVTSDGRLSGVVKTYSDYSSAGSGTIICKGTLDNVISGKGLDVTGLAGFDSTKIQTLKQSGGTPMWVTDNE